MKQNKIFRFHLQMIFSVLWQRRLYWKTTRSRSVGELVSAWSVDLSGARHWRVEPECDPPTCNPDPTACITSLAPARTRITLVIHQIRFYSDFKMSCELCCNIISTHNCAATTQHSNCHVNCWCSKNVALCAVLSCQLSAVNVARCWQWCWHMHGSVLNMLIPHTLPRPNKDQHPGI